MKENLPAIVTLSSEASYAETYDNHAVANVNDHVVRISTMTQVVIFLLFPTAATWAQNRNQQQERLAQAGGLEATMKFIQDTEFDWTCEVRRSCSRRTKWG
jgi:hypothetical protein